MANLWTDTGGATITTMIPSYYDSVWLKRLQKNLSYDKHGVQKPLPLNEGSSMIWHQMLNTGEGYALHETTPHEWSCVSTRKVSAAIVWRGDVRSVTTRVVATTINPMVKEMSDALGYGAALTRDSYIAEAIGFGSIASVGVADAASVALPSAYTHGFPLFEGNREEANWSVTALANGLFSAVPDIDHIARAVTHLKNMGARTFEDGTYHGIIHPTVAGKLRADSNFITWMANTNRAAMERGKLGIIENVMFEESQNAMTAAVLSSNWSGYVSSGTLYGTLIVGQGAYGVTKLRGEDARIQITKGPDKSDPHDLNTLISYKFAIAAKVLNPSAGVICTWLKV